MTIPAINNKVPETDYQVSWISGTWVALSLPWSPLFSQATKPEELSWGEMSFLDLA